LPKTCLADSNFADIDSALVGSVVIYGFFYGLSPGGAARLFLKTLVKPTKT